MSFPPTTFQFGLLNDRKASNRLLKWYLIILILTFGLITSNAIGQTRRPVQRRGSVNQTAPAVSSTIEADDKTPMDPVIVAESQRAQQRDLEERQKLESALVARNEPAQTSVDDMWRGFRQTLPFHSQVIALSEATTDGSRTLIISEPPPHVSLPDILTSVGADLLLNHQVKKQRIGYDGWVKDVAIAIKGDNDALQAMLSRLNQRLFFTSYKSYTLKLPVKIRTEKLDLNLTVTPAELNQWIISEAEQFFPVEGGPAETFQSLSRQQSSGVYVSHKRGLIGWWIPKKRNLYECRVPARQFALDADLIIGALANQAGVLVVGREREVPVDILPPLRFETLALLADVQEGQRGGLAQSYQRNAAFAGRIGEGKDWAPILLSPQLRDTEYGSLLNITDQLLKGWSNGGATTYENFPYPSPGRYPFPKPLFTELALGSGGESLTYNWNTKGVGFTVNFGPTTFLALNRSGSLPVSYIPEGTSRTAAHVSAAEDTGYDYFSNVGDPNLARVVQYAATYQIFSAFDVARSNKQISADSYPDQLLETMTTELNNSLKGASDGELDKITEQLTPPIRLTLDDSIAKSWNKAQEDINKEINQALLSKGYRPGTKEYTDNLDRVLALVKKDYEEKVREQLTKSIKEQLTLAKLDQPAKDDIGQTLRSEVLSRYAELKQMPQRYAATIDQRAHGWIHTPVVVISSNTDVGFVGGHNLDARVSKIKVDERLAPGQVSIDATGALVVSPADVARARGLARTVERNGLFRELAIAYNENNAAKATAVQAEIQLALTKAETAAVRPRGSALNLTSAPPPNKPPINKPPISTGEPGGAGGAGWGGDGRSSLPIAGDWRPSGDSVVRIKARENRFDVEYESGTAGRAFQLRGLTHEDAVDLAALQASRKAKAREAVVIEFEGLSEQKALATLRSVEIQSAQRGSSMEFIGVLSDGPIAASPKGIAKRYAFNRTKVEVGEIKTLETGELQQDIALNVPATDNSGQVVSFKSELKFNRSTPREVVAAITNRVSTAYASLARRWGQVTSNASYEIRVAKYNADLARSLKKIRTSTKLNFDVKSKVNLNFSVGTPQGLKDIYIGKNLFIFAQPEAALGS